MNGKRIATDDEVAAEVARQVSWGVTDAETRNATALTEGYYSERCLECQQTLLAYHHFVRCERQSCPMKDGQGSILERMLDVKPEE